KLRLPPRSLPRRLLAEARSALRRSGWRWGSESRSASSSVDAVPQHHRAPGSLRIFGGLPPRALGEGLFSHGEKLPRRQLGGWFWNFRPRLLPDEEMERGGADGGLPP